MISSKKPWMFLSLPAKQLSSWVGLEWYVEYENNNVVQYPPFNDDETMSWSVAVLLVDKNGSFETF